MSVRSDIDIDVDVRETGAISGSTLKANSTAAS